MIVVRPFAAVVLAAYLATVLAFGVAAGVGQ